MSVKTAIKFGAALIALIIFNILSGSLITQEIIYTRCLENGHAVQVCKEITK